MRGHRYAYLGVGVGLAVSIWANIAHAGLQPGGADRGALALAGFWPLGLFLALEVLTRTEWSGGTVVVVARLGVVLVASVAAVVSYLHLHGLLQHYGEAALPAMIGPLGIDGLMAVSAAALLQRQAPAPDEVGTVQVTAPVIPVPAEFWGLEPEPALEAEVLTSGTALEAEVLAPVEASEPALEPDPAPERVEALQPRPVPVAAARTQRPAQVTAAVDGDDPLLAAARAVAEQVTGQDLRLTRAVLLEALRDRGHACGTTKAGHLLAQVQVRPPEPA